MTNRTDIIELIRDLHANPTDSDALNALRVAVCEADQDSLLDTALAAIAYARRHATQACDHCDGEGTEVACGAGGYYDAPCSHCS